MMGTNNTNAPATEATTTEVVKELGPRQKFRLEPVLMVATTNPKKPGSASHERFEGYSKIDWTKPQTVGSVLDGRIVRMDDIRNDSDKGYIVVGADNIAAHNKAMEAQKKADIAAAKKLLASVEG